MSETKFTPGPWRADGPDMFGDYNILHPDDSLAVAAAVTDFHTIDPLAVAAAVTNLRSPDEVRANARLIAAAPEMYAALRVAQMALADQKTANAKGYTERARKSVDAALAKAEGRS